MNVRMSLLSLTLTLALSACYMGEPIPVECVCQCDQSSADSPAAAPATPTAAQKEATRDAIRAKRLAAKKKAAAKGISPVAKRISDAARRSESRVARQPGSGEILKTDERTRVTMLKNYGDFLRGASAKSLEPLKPYLTARLYTSLEKNLPKYEDRFFNGLKESIAALGKGDATIKETRDMGRGNVEALVVFANGHERRVIFLQEDNTWKLNRL